MCNFFTAIFYMLFIYLSTVQHFTFSNGAELLKEKICLTEQFCLVFFLLYLFLNKYLATVFIGII